MANSTPSRTGQNLGAGDVRALNLDLYAGEVITAYESKTVMRDKHMTKTLSKGRTFKFPAIWRATGGYHTPGVEITGDQIQHTEITIDPDDKLVASVFLADIDEILLHYDARAPYTKELGEFLARHYDANVIRSVILAARGAALFSGDQGGSALTNAAYATTAQTIIDGISTAKQTMDEKDVPVDGQPLYALLQPAQWYLVARSDRNLNKDFSSSGASTQKMTLTTVDDVSVIKSNVASTVFGVDNTSTTAIPSAYRANFTNTRGVVWTPYAAASAIVQDVGFQLVDQPEKQGTLMIARMMVGTRKLRSKCAVELKIA